MAGIPELNSFVHKFINLWQAGRNATLKLDSKAGEASVTLHVDLGQVVPLSPPHVPLNARDRRRQRRANAHRTIPSEATVNVSETVTNDIENAADTEKVEVDVVLENAVAAENLKVVVNNAENAQKDSINP